MKRLQEWEIEPTTRFSPSMGVSTCLICAQMCWVESMVMIFLMVSNVFAVSFGFSVKFRESTG